MKKQILFPIVVVFTGMFLFGSCGPIILSPAPQSPPPPWFYPNRVETVRYVYFPDYVIYYDLYSRNYIYLENNVWIRVKVLPPQYRTIDLNRSKFVRVNGYRDDSIRNYHSETYPSSPRSSRVAKPRGRSN